MFPPDYIMRWLKSRALGVEIVLSLLAAWGMIRFASPSRRRAWLDVSPLTADPDDAARHYACNVGRKVARIAHAAPLDLPCLPQALATRWVLARRGMASRLVIGAQRDPAKANGMDLHAWLMIGETCVSGGEARARHRALS